MSKRFVSQALRAQAGSPTGSNEPSLPPVFDWNGERLEVSHVLRTWRSTKTDRGDVYLKRHWFEFATKDGRVATVYFDRAAKSGDAHWWLYTIECAPCYDRGAMHEYLLYDVFAERAFEGNPLAVFPDAQSFDAYAMQRIANELNLSESVFLTRGSDEHRPARVRIFTPASEMAFAGHPTIGATVAIAGELAWTNADAFVLEENIGDVNVRVERGGDMTAWLETPPVSFGASFSREDGAQVLNLHPGRVRMDLPVQLAGAGNPFLYVPLVDVAAVDAAVMNESHVKEFMPDTRRLNGVFLFAQTAEGTYSRMFAPMSGIAEDAATGSAHGPLYAYLVEHNALPAKDASYTALQGVKMGRRSVLQIRVRMQDGRPIVDVGGRAILVGSGKLTDPVQVTSIQAR